MQTRVITVVALLCLLVPAMMGGCGGSVKLFIDSPVNGTFTTASSVLVEGRITKLNPANAVLTVNGVPVTVQPDRTWSTTVAITDIVNPIVASLTLGTGPLKQRVTVIQGESIADGDLSPMAVALRLNDSGLNQVEPVVTSLVDLDLATLLPAGTLVINDFCYQDSFLGCLGRVDVTVSGSPPPSVGSFSVDVDAQTNSVDGDVQLNNLFIRANVDDATGVPLHCEIDITAATTNVFANYFLSPKVGNPSEIDVVQNGSANLVFGSFGDSTDCSGLLGGLVELLIGLFIGDIQSLVEPAIEGFLNTTDGSGNTPIAGAIEVALAGVEISGPIGQAIGVNLETPLFDVFEDVNGITLDNDVRITATQPAPGAVDLAASYHIPEAFPSFGPTTPVGGVPYDMAICISSSGFNQLLKAEIESGLLLASVTELDLGGGPQPLTAGLIGFIPGFDLLDPSTPLRIDLQPTLGPMITGAAGPGGELAEMKVAHLLATVVVDDPGQQVLLSFAVDVDLGLDLDFIGGALSFELGAIQAGNIDLTVLQNTFNIFEPGLISLLQFLLPSVLPSLATSLGTFPLPDFLGLSLDLVEVSKNGAFMSLFVNLTPVP